MAVPSKSGSLFQLLENRGIFQGGDVLCNRFAFRQHAQQAAHDFAGAGLGEVVAEADFLGLGDRADFLGDPVAQFQGQFASLFAGGAGLLEDHEGADRFARRVVRLAHHGRFRDEGVGDQGRFDFHRAHAVARDVEDVVDAARDGEVAGVLVADGAVAGQVVFAAQLVREVAGLEALGVVPDGADHGGPGLFDDQDAALPVRDVRARFVDDGRHDARQRKGAGAGDHRGGAGQWGDHVAARFRLPEGVDDGAVLVADVFVVPHPGFRVDRLAHRTQEAQAGQVVVLRVHFRVDVGGLDEGTDCGRGRVKNADLVLGDGVPEAARIRVGRDAFEHDFSSAHGQRAIRDIAVASHPADVGGAPEHVFRLDVESPLHRQCRPQQVAAGGVLHALRRAGRAGSVEDEQGVLGLDPDRFAVGALAIDQLVQPDIPALLEGDVAGGALVDDDVADGVAAAQRQRFVDDGFQGQTLAAAQLFVGGDDGHGAGVDDALLQGLGGKAAEDDGVGGADAGAGLHGGHAFDRHRHVDDDPVALLDAARLETVGEFADALVQFAVAGAGDAAVVGFEDDGGFFGVAVLQVAVEAVVGGIQLAVAEPFIERRVRLVEGLGERGLPVQVFARQPGPEAFVVAGRLGA